MLQSKGLAVVALCCALFVSSMASAQDWGIQGSAPLSTTPIEDCGFGNLDAITVAGPIWEVGGESTLLVDPAAGCPQCQMGVRVYWINTTIWVDSDCTVELRTKFRSYKDQGQGCKSPGELECTGPALSFELTAGFNRVEFPTEGCGCADINYEYLLGLELVSADCTEVRRTANDIGSVGPSCTSWYISPSGDEVDEADGGIPGQLGMFAYSVCCEKPIPTENTSFGSVKSSFDE